jgi:hypothetical protein
MEERKTAAGTPDVSTCERTEEVLLAPRLVKQGLEQATLFPTFLH